MGERSVNHCENLTADRKLGDHWERQFCVMMANQGKMFTPMQIGRSSSAVAWAKTNGHWNHFTLPDVTVWTYPGEHHELKHKTATRHGSYGLERYRLDALVGFARETDQDVFYTIHDHHGNRDDLTNHLGDWVTANVMTLADCIELERWGDSYVGGAKKRVPICYWSSQFFFRPLFVNNQ